jgi:hypothetical protein
VPNLRVKEHSLATDYELPCLPRTNLPRNQLIFEPQFSARPHFAAADPPSAFNIHTVLLTSDVCATDQGTRCRRQ